MKTMTRRSLPLGYILLAVLAAVGVGVGIVRLINGLGTTTSLNDSYPWGLWIVYDVFFVPFSAGAFMILALAHIYNRKEYHSIARPVVLAGFLGEIMVIAVLVMDLGRWHQFYNVLFPWYWNINSFMFQVSICLTVYMGIMVLEVAPALLERLNWYKPLRLIKALTLIIAIIGCVLSALHQTALGSLFLLMPYRLDALWWTSLLPLLFFVSAVFGGLSMAILVTTLSFRAFHRPLNMSLLADLARVASAVLGVYLTLKIGDLVAAGEWRLLFSEGWLSALFWLELIIGVVMPLLLFGVRRSRESVPGLIWGSVCVLTGLLINRTNVSLLAQRAPAGPAYVPHWMEVIIALAAVAAGILLFALAARFLPILPQSPRDAQSRRDGGWSPRTLILACGALCLLVLLVVVSLHPMARAEAYKTQTAPAPGLYESPREGNCQTCHQDPHALAEAGAGPDALGMLSIQPLPPDEPHATIQCVTCHYGDDTSSDSEPAHLGIILDPSAGEADLCIACHQDLPDEFPEDRLRTPHDKVTHGEAAGVACSDCHGAVGHGFDPVSGEIICPMNVCMDCHRSLQLDSTLSDCNACHISPHQTLPSLRCSSCHHSTQEWQEVGMSEHPVELAGQHAQAQCFDCHQDSSFAGEVTTECADCHQPPTGTHYGSSCQDCHQPTSFSDARLLDHPLELVGAHRSASCASCHDDQGTVDYVCSNCHQRPENHLPGECSICHTPDGWVSSAASLVAVSPRLTHGLEGQEDCLMCHDPAGQIKAAPSNHDVYENFQCLLCHKAEP
jgi:Ni/Fe-hydrogenase subunit HybB-like protein